MATSPDGGIYVNSDDLAVVLLATVDGAPIATRLGDRAAEWPALGALGRFTVVGIRLRNDGKAGSEPALNDLQMASDFAPAATAVRAAPPPLSPHLPARRPQRPSDRRRLHRPPRPRARAATVLLVYPPLRPAPVYLWGRFARFALELRPGGRRRPSHGDLHAAACTPPQQPV